FPVKFIRWQNCFKHLPQSFKLFFSDRGVSAWGVHEMFPTRILAEVPRWCKLETRTLVARNLLRRRRNCKKSSQSTAMAKSDKITSDSPNLFSFSGGRACPEAQVSFNLSIATHAVIRPLVADRTSEPCSKRS